MTANKTDITKQQQNLLTKIPGVDIVLRKSQEISFLATAPKQILTDCIRNIIEQIRVSILDNSLTHCDNHEEQLSIDVIINKVQRKVKSALSHNLLPVINATGVVIHTNLGRSLLPTEIFEHLFKIATKYSNLEYNLLTSKRGLRYHIVEDLICKITGAKAAMVVNNNAAAVLLCLDTMASKKEVIVSRGELVEIGGSFRIPDVMVKSGAILKEVGTTNRTHLKDYKDVISDKTGLLLKVHTSNFSITGFTASVKLRELVKLGNKFQIPVMEDLGSGTFVDFSKYKLIKEPTVMESVASGVDIVTFSGDKLLGGPQAGIILSSPAIIKKIRANPLTRALRIDKLTLAALEAILLLYLDKEKALEKIPTLKMLTSSVEQLQIKAQELYTILKNLNDNRLKIQILNSSSKVGGGSLPLLELPSRCVGISIKDVSANFIEKKMRHNKLPIIGRIDNDIYLMDLRTICKNEFSYIAKAVNFILRDKDYKNGTKSKSK